MRYGFVGSDFVNYRFLYDDGIWDNVVFIYLDINSSWVEILILENWYVYL